MLKDPLENKAAKQIDDEDALKRFARGDSYTRIAFDLGVSKLAVMAAIQRAIERRKAKP